MKECFPNYINRGGCVFSNQWLDIAIYLRKMAVASSVHVFLSIGNRHFLWEEDELRMSTIYLEDRNIYMYTFIVKVYNYKKVILVRNLHS